MRFDEVAAYFSKLEAIGRRFSAVHPIAPEDATTEGEILDLRRLQRGRTRA